MHILTTDHLKKGYSYENYQETARNLFAIGRTTAEAPSMNTPDHLHYTKLNLQRTTRVEKSRRLSTEMKEALETIAQPQHWFVLVESWCGDVPHTLPIIQKMTVHQPLINMHILLRDKNLDVMDAYLTNGGRGIPKLIAFDGNLDRELFTWGPRPAPLQKMVKEFRDQYVAYAEVSEAVQKWYNTDKAATLQREFIDLLRSIAS